VEERLKAIEIGIAADHAAMNMLKKALIFGGLVLIALWGYSNFVTIPAEAIKAFKESTVAEVLKEATASRDAARAMETEVASLLAKIRNAEEFTKNPPVFSIEVISATDTSYVTQAAKFCALSTVKARAWPKDATSICEVTVDNGIWKLQASEMANGKAWCKMVCWGAELVK